MKKNIIILLLALFVCASLAAQKLNIMTTSGKLITGEKIGSDDTSVFIKTSDGNATTVALKKIKKVFDADTMKDLTSEYMPGTAGQPAAESSAAPTPASAAASDIDRKKQELEARFKSGAISHHEYMKELGKLLNGANAQAPAQAANTGTIAARTNEQALPEIQYETVEGEAGTTELTSPFTRTVQDYFDVDVDYLMVNLLASSDNARLKQVMKSFTVGTYDDSTFMASFGFGAAVYLRPFDWFAIGGFYTTSFINQNMNVFRGDEEITGGDWDRYMFMDMPTAAYGVVFRFIPYSSAEATGNGELSENFAFGIDIRLGAATLGSPFAAAGINDEASSPDTVNVLTADPATYFAIELNICSESNFIKFALGYQQFMFNQLNASTYLAGVTNAGNVVADSGGPIPFSGQGFYLRSSIIF
jgi:hypothetical protein